MRPRDGLDKVWWHGDPQWRWPKFRHPSPSVIALSAVLGCRAVPPPPPQPLPLQPPQQPPPPPPSWKRWGQLSAPGFFVSLAGVNRIYANVAELACLLNNGLSEQCPRGWRVTRAAAVGGHGGSLVTRGSCPPPPPPPWSRVGLAARVGLFAECCVAAVPIQYRISDIRHRWTPRYESWYRVIDVSPSEIWWNICDNCKKTSCYVFSIRMLTSGIIAVFHI